MTTRNLKLIFLPIVIISLIPSMLLASDGGQQNSAAASIDTVSKTQVVNPANCNNWQKVLQQSAKARRERSRSGTQKKGYRHKPAQHVKGSQFFEENSDTVTMPKAEFENMEDSYENIAAQIGQNTKILDKSAKNLDENTKILDKNIEKQCEIGKNVTKIQIEMKKLTEKLETTIQNYPLSHFNSDNSNECPKIYYKEWVIQQKPIQHSWYDTAREILKKELFKGIKVGDIVKGIVVVYGADRLLVACFLPKLRAIPLLKNRVVRVMYLAGSYIITDRFILSFLEKKLKHYTKAEEQKQNEASEEPKVHCLEKNKPANTKNFWRDTCWSGKHLIIAGSIGIGIGGILVACIK